MKIHRFIVNSLGGKKELIITDKELVNQIRNVLRLKTGQPIILADRDSREASATITGFTKGVQVTINGIRENTSEPAVAVRLYCALIKRDNFEWVAQKATEIGVSEIIPIITKRTVKLDFSQARLEKIIKEAAEQSGRGKLPLLHRAMPLNQALAQAKKNGHNIVYDGSGTLQLRQLAESDTVADMGIFIGPEGGWDPTEIALAREAGFAIASLGTLTLRAETAAIVASYLAVHYNEYRI